VRPSLWWLDGFGVFTMPQRTVACSIILCIYLVACGGGFDRVFADKKDLVASDCERVADTPSEFEQLANSIPESFDEGLPPSF
jgi:hypothetical protein